MSHRTACGWSQVRIDSGPVALNYGTFAPRNFRSLKRKFHPGAKVLVMYNFVTFATWIQSRLWPAKSLTAFQSPVRTNNDDGGLVQPAQSPDAPASWTYTSWLLSCTRRRRLLWSSLCSCPKSVCSAISARRTAVCKAVCRSTGVATRPEN